MEVFNFLPSLSFIEGWLCIPNIPALLRGNSTHSQCLSEEIVLPPYRGMKKMGGKLQSFITSSLHQCHRGGDSEFKEQGSGMLKLQKQKGMFLVICHTFCMVDGTVKRFSLALGNIFQDHRIRNVRFISTLFILFLKGWVCCFFLHYNNNGGHKQNRNCKNALVMSDMFLLSI